MQSDVPFFRLCCVVVTLAHDYFCTYCMVVHNVDARLEGGTVCHSVTCGVVDVLGRFAVDVDATVDDGNLLCGSLRGPYVRGVDGFRLAGSEVFIALVERLKRFGGIF